MKYFIYLQYDGAAYHGWQIQPNAISVQQVLQEKLSMLLRRELFVVGAGRTDAGVNARLMVAHFVYDAEGETPDHTDPAYLLDCAALAQRLCQVLPPDISVYKVVPVRPEAHARYSPLTRMYRYYVTTRKQLWQRAYSYRIYQELDLDLMNEAASRLSGYTDFSSFAKVHTDVKTHDCRVVYARWTDISPESACWDGRTQPTTGVSPVGPAGHDYVFEIRADRFLRGMVRAIVGTLLNVGRGRITVDEFCRIVERQNRGGAGDSVPGEALFLEDVEYPSDIFL